MTMEAALSQLNAVPGVVGSLVCDRRGQVRAQAFPAGIDAAHVAQAALLLADGAEGLALAQGTTDLVDFRFAESRLVVKAWPGALLLVQCGKATNLQFLTIAIGVAAAKLAQATADPPVAPAPAPARDVAATEGGREKKRVPLPAKGLGELQRRLASASGPRTNPEKA
jgi:predicted regulator of Ras-like GTPase activity (Roadblock/LC7/MglB family)